MRIRNIKNIKPTKLKRFIILMLFALSNMQKSKIQNKKYKTHLLRLNEISFLKV